MKKAVSLVSIVVLVLSLALCGCAPKTCAVTFNLNGGKMISGELMQTVAVGSAAKAPKAENGRLALKWDKSFSNVTKDMTVTAKWTKVAMETTKLAEYVQKCTVTVNVTNILGDKTAGSGFFIDNKGTIVTNYHVIDMGAVFSVQTSDGGKYELEKVIGFSPVYDIAILKIDAGVTPCLDLCKEAAKAGENVYAVGSALGELNGTFTAGMVSSASRKFGKIDCIQMDAAISEGNSGGPLVNKYGEVVGINAASYVDGEALNLAIKIATLDKLARDKNYTQNEFKEWYTKESSRSFSPMDSDGVCHYSLVNTYQCVTGRKCDYSYTDDDTDYDGYIDCYAVYGYDYNNKEYDKYVAYLKDIGFVYQDEEKSDEDGSTTYYYYNEKDSIEVALTINLDSTYLWIQVTLEE